MTRQTQLFLPNSLVDSYGGMFPSASEQDHMMAIRGLLVRWVQLKSISAHAHSEVSRAINWMEEQIAKECGVSYKELPNAPETLVDHYQHSVSWNLGWLHLLSTFLHGTAHN